MEISQAIVPIATAIIGIATGHYFTVRNKSRESLDNWWEQYAVTNGTEPVLEFLTNIERERTIPKSIKEKIPHRALLHLQGLMGNDILTEYCHGIVNFFGGYTITGDYDAHKQLLMDMVECVYTLEIVFYDQTLQKKSDIMRIKAVEEVKNVVIDMKITSDNYANVIGSTAEPSNRLS